MKLYRKEFRIKEGDSLRLWNYCLPGSSLSPWDWPMKTAYTLYNKKYEREGSVILCVKNIYTAQKIVGISEHFRWLNRDIKVSVILENDWTLWPFGQSDKTNDTCRRDADKLSVSAFWALPGSILGLNAEHQGQSWRILLKILFLTKYNIVSHNTNMQYPPKILQYILYNSDSWAF